MTPYDVSLARAGRITSSRIAVIANGDYRSWNTLADAMRKASPAPIGQRSGVPQLDWGHKYEPRACAEFFFRHPEYDVENEPFRYWHDPKDRVHWQLCSASPDRTLYQRLQFVGVVEAKCPYNPGIHRQYWSDGVVPEIYRPQVYWQMIVTDSDHGWFVSYDPREPLDVGYFDLKVPRGEPYEAALMAKVDRFIGGYLAGETFKKPSYDYATIF